MKIVVSAGEVSGDIHGSYLISEIKKINPDISFLGMGGEGLNAIGVEILFDISSKGSIGLVEALPNVVSIYATFLKMKRLLADERPDALLLVDSQGFNVPLASFAKKLGIKTIYYIPPHEWLWGTEKNLKNIADKIDLIVSIFEREHNAYKKVGGNSIYFGHPLLDIVKPELLKEEAQNKFNPEKKKMVTLCPGSRRQEIENIFPILVKSAEIIKEALPETLFYILASSDWAKEKIADQIKNSKIKDFQIAQSQRYDVLNISDLAIAASGTINLETSILGTPNLMVYTLNPLTYFIAKNILKINRKMKFFSMPNILVDAEIVPEFAQKRANPHLIAHKAVEILTHQEGGNPYSRLLDNETLLKTLGKPPVISKIAEEIVRFIQKN